MGGAFVGSQADISLVHIAQDFLHGRLACEGNRSFHPGCFAGKIGFELKDDDVVVDRQEPLRGLIPTREGRVVERADIDETIFREYGQ
eukprot:scaffold7392_cov286-Pinguiococcus_pyrenoidosus.AAC.2